MRKLVYVSGTRADYGLMSSTLKLWRDSKQLDVSICVTGMHLSDKFGRTVQEIHHDGLKVCEEIPVNIDQADGGDMAKALASELSSMVDVFRRVSPDVVVVLGDRGEMLAGALAAIHLNIPVVHIHGGERSGTIDEPVRHAISKLSHYHFTATEDARQRLIKMGENNEHIFTVGAPGLDGLQGDASYNKQELCDKVGFNPRKPIILVVFHPVVQHAKQAGSEAQEILSAVDSLKHQVLWLLPNADAGGDAIREVIESEGRKGSNILQVVTHLQRSEFVSWMKHADVMLGNSSSGIIEAATYGTPVVNVGIRQQGRERSANVIDVEVNEIQIKKALVSCLETEKKGIVNVYGKGQSGKNMLNLLTVLPLDKPLLNKLNAY